MRIGELAARAGMAPSRIRFYESCGLLREPPRRANGYRDYDEQALETLVFIARARDLGFPLADVARHLASPRNSRRKTRLLAAVKARIRQLDALADGIAKQRSALTRAVAELERHERAANRSPRDRRR